MMDADNRTGTEKASRAKNTLDTSVASHPLPPPPLKPAEQDRAA